MITLGAVMYPVFFGSEKEEIFWVANRTDVLYNKWKKGRTTMVSNHKIQTALEEIKEIS